MIGDLDKADLLVDETYGGSRNGNASDDPLPMLLGVSSGGGFRHLGKRPETESLRMLVLKTNFSDSNWPDALDRETGIFTYYGDKRSPGDLHETNRDGNSILRNLFDYAHAPEQSGHFPPIFIFGDTGLYRDVRFLGLVVPGAEGLTSDEDLVAVWRTTPEGIRFQNYKATFTVLDIGQIPRAWIDDIQSGKAVTSPHAPEPWLDWVRGRKYTPLHSIPARTIRTKHEQLPPPGSDLEQLVTTVRQRFAECPIEFERCAAELAKLFMPGIHSCDVTRPSRDGGRDAIGFYRIGTGAGHIDVEFALEAKCYSPHNSVGIRELSRLISRLRHRQFGILVTTSYLGEQAYRELQSDGHPVVVISAIDIARKLKEKLGSTSGVTHWLARV